MTKNFLDIVNEVFADLFIIWFSERRVVSGDAFFSAAGLLAHL